MYTFDKQVIGPFAVFKSVQSRGDRHVKRFQAGVTPQNQATLNVYISGEFRLTFGLMERVMSAGQTSLEVGVDSYPEGTVMREEVLSETGTRYCISATSGGQWFREKLSLAGGESFADDSVLVVLSGQINGSGAGGLLNLAAGQQVSGTGVAVRCWKQPDASE